MEAVRILRLAECRAPAANDALDTGQPYAIIMVHEGFVLGPVGAPEAAPYLLMGAWRELKPCLQASPPPEGHVLCVPIDAVERAAQIPDVAYWGECLQTTVREPMRDPHLATFAATLCRAASLFQEPRFQAVLAFILIEVLQPITVPKWLRQEERAVLETLLELRELRQWNLVRHAEATHQSVRSVQRSLAQSPVAGFRVFFSRLNRRQVLMQTVLHPFESVSHIAAMLGFAHVPNFSQYFKQATGMTPKAFQKVLRQACT